MTVAAKERAYEDLLLRIEWKEMVFGIDVTANGVSCAVSLPDGRLIGLASTAANDRYLDLMQDWFNLATESNATNQEKAQSFREQYPIEDMEGRRAVADSWSHFMNGSKLSWIDRLAYKAGWDPRDMSMMYAQTYLQGDEATEILADTLAQLRLAALEALADITDLPIPSRPYVEISLPGWLFDNIPFLPDDCEPEEQFTSVGAGHYPEITQRVSVAAHRAGFRRSVDDSPSEIMRQHAKGDNLYGPTSAPTMAIRSALNGTCEFPEAGKELCQLKTREQQWAGKQVVALIDSQAISGGDIVMLWVQSSLGQHTGAAVWQIWQLSAGNKPLTGDEKLVNELVEGIMNLPITNKGSKLEAKTQIPILLTGQSWSRDSISNLKHVLDQHGIQHQITQSSNPFLSAISAAELARYEWLNLAAPHLDERFYPEVMERRLKQRNREL